MASEILWALFLVALIENVLDFMIPNQKVWEFFQEQCTKEVVKNEGKGRILKWK